MRDMDTSVRPQDDFFHYVNGGWMKRNPIPASESRWGSFVKLRYTVDRQIYTLFKELEKQKRVPKGSPQQMIRDFYRSGMDMRRRNAKDLAPLNSYRSMIRSVRTTEDLQRLMVEFSRMGVDFPWGTYVDQDDKDSTKYVLRFTQDGLGLPDRDYYLKDDAESVRVRTAYRTHVERLYRMIGRTQKEAAAQAEAQLALETKLAKASMTKVERRDPEKTYHKMTLRELRDVAPHVDWEAFCSGIGATHIRTVIVSQPKFMKVSARLLAEIDTETWKNYAEWHLVQNFSAALSSRFVRASFSFYGKVLTGAKTLRPLWRRTLGAVNSRLDELVGQVYVTKHFPPEAKKKMEALVADLFTAYEARIKNLAWMSPATKKKALQKLRALNRKIGYPDKWKSYAGLAIDTHDYAGNIIRAIKHDHARQMRKLGRPIDRTEWFMSPQTVNAYFAPNMNDIVFPAAILQPPFFYVNGDDAYNYGCIGAVIGHEITHGFDDEGSKFDMNGNLKSWWTVEDRRRFTRRAEVLRKQFDTYEVADGVKVNGKLTLGENIADLGGLSIALDAFYLRAAKHAPEKIGGMTRAQRFFIGYAIFERENVRPEFEKMMVLTDPHAPGMFRINGPVSNLTEFYEAFGVKKGDALYREANERAKIW